MWLISVCNMNEVFQAEKEIIHINEKLGLANLELEQRRKAFESTPVRQEAPVGSFSDYIREKAVLFCAFLCAELKEAFGNAGLLSFADALHSFEQESAALLEDIASRRGIPCDRRLLESSFPFSLREPSTLWDRLSAEEACALFMKTVAAPLAARYDKAAACAE